MKSIKKLREMIEFYERKVRENTPPPPKQCPTCGRYEIQFCSGDICIFPNDVATWREKAKLLKWVLEDEE